MNPLGPINLVHVTVRPRHRPYMLTEFPLHFFKVSKQLVSEVLHVLNFMVEVDVLIRAIAKNAIFVPASLAGIMIENGRKVEHIYHQAC